MSKDPFEIVAAIDVGSNYIRMIIAKVTPKGEMITLEDLKQSTHVGRDSFASGKITLESIHEICKHLKGFMQLMKEYKIKNYKAVCTSGIREAENGEYVLEQIRLKTGLEVEIINNAQERFLMYKGIREHLSSSKELYDQGTLLLNITSGGVEVSVYQEGSLKFTEYVKIGSLRLVEILADLEKMTLDFPSIMEEFVESKIYTLTPLIRSMELQNFIGLGGELGAISNICIPSDVEEEKFIKRKALHQLYQDIRKMTTEQVIEHYGIPQNQAQILLPSVIIFKHFLEMTHAKGIYAPMVSLRHGLLAEISDDYFNTNRKQQSLEDVISSVWYIGRKYGMDEVHAAYVENLALSIFEQTRRIHRLGYRERLYLQAAAILHDIGKYVNLNEHDVYSSSIVLSQGIMGFSNRELRILADVLRCHSGENLSYAHDNSGLLEGKDKIIVSKLVAILKLAESLDISHKQKVKGLDIVIQEEEILFKVHTKEDILLEKWDFTYQAKFFEEVMGYRPIIKYKG